MANNILVVAEGRPEGLRKVSHELVNAAKQIESALGGEVVGAVVGSNTSDWADALAKTGVSRVYIVDNPALGSFAPETYATALAEIIRDAEPAIILIGAYGVGQRSERANRRQTGLGLVTDCTGATIENGALVLTRPIYAG